MKWLKRTAIAFAVLLLIVVAAAWWLLGTSAGLHFALARAQSATDGALQVQQASGRLSGPLTLTGVHYDDGHGTVVKLAKARLDLRIWPLLVKHLHVLALDAEGIDVSLPESAADDAANDGSFTLQPPLEITLDRAHVGAVKVTQAGETLFVCDSLDLGGHWSNDGIAVRQLVLRGPDGQAQLDGTLALGKTYQGNGKASFSWKVGDIDYAGNLGAHGDGDIAQLDLELTAPTLAKLQLSLTQHGDFPWSGKLDVPRFDPSPLLGSSSLQSLAVAMQGHGDQRGGTLEGQLDLNDYVLLLQPLRARFSADGDTLTLEQLKLGSPQIQGSVEASGSVQLAATPLSAALDIRWNDLQLPADLTGQELVSQGKLQVNGSADNYHASGDATLGPPGKPVTITLDLDGSPKQIALRALDLDQTRGKLHANGTLTLQPDLAWQAQATASKFDPGQWFAGWNGALDFDITSDGRVRRDGPDTLLEIHQLGGTLRERAIRGSGKLHLSADDVLDGDLELGSAHSNIRIIGKPGNSNDIELKLAVASLGDWLPDAAGRLDGHLSIRGKQPAFSVNGQLHGAALAWQQNKAQTLDLIVGLPDISHPAGKLDLRTDNVYLEGLLFQHVNLLAEGSQGDHRLRLDAHGSQLSGLLELHGGLKGSAWNGTLGTLDLEPQGMPSWHLRQPAQLAYNDGAMNLSELCLTAGEPELCLTAKQDKPGNLDASYRLQALPLALLLNAAGDAELPLRAEGNIDGSGKIRRSRTGALDGTATLRSDHGLISYTDNTEAPLLRYQQLHIDAQLSPTSQRVTINGSLGNGGSIDGQAMVSGASQTLTGQLDLRLNNLAFIELFTHDLANIKGSLDGSFRAAGTLQQPIVTGQARAHGFAAEIPAIGLKLSGGELTIGSNGGEQLLIQGQVKSGAGSLTVHGEAGLGADAQTLLTIKGSQFTAIDIPAARVVMSPDLTLKQDAKGIDIGGGLRIDSADVNANKLPGAGTTQASADVVVVDEKEQQQAASKLPLTAVIKVDLGNKTHVTGMGLDGRVSGLLTVIERPGRATVGQGQIAVNGTYRAYGQNLSIQRGQLLFASTPIDNPGLNIKAIRKLNPNATIDEGQEVGLFVSGTAQRPILTVFSNPVMEQSDALSYLVTGKPLSQVKGGEGDMVGAAAQALGSAAGDLLAKSIGSKLGVDDIGVSSNEALGGSSAFTVGKYLSPRLYLSYGVGLFEPGEVITLRYRFSKRWNLEAQQATEFSRASFNYRIEK